MEMDCSPPSVDGEEIISPIHPNSPMFTTSAIFTNEAGAESDNEQVSGGIDDIDQGGFKGFESVESANEETGRENVLDSTIAASPPSVDGEEIISPIHPNSPMFTTSAIFTNEAGAESDNEQVSGGIDDIDQGGFKGFESVESANEETGRENVLDSTIAASPPSVDGEEIISPIHPNSPMFTTSAIFTNEAGAESDNEQVSGGIDDIDQGGFKGFESVESANEETGRENVLDSTIAAVGVPATTAEMSTSNGFKRVYSLRKRTSQKTPFVGLINQGATCYLNCLLQALYMTPHFRDMVWGWKEADLAKGTVRYELHQLFIGLKTSKKAAIETKKLTKSFGWPARDLYEQQDIQELWRVLFDALESSLKGTDDLKQLHALYEGEMLDYVKCTECSTTSSRPVVFQDVSLPLRAFGSIETYRTIEEALDAFVAVESLTGDNQYNCEKCGKKCNACKGLTFSRFPQILTFQLKRFVYEQKRSSRGKNNDYTAFPEYLDLDKYVSKDVTLEDKGLSGQDSKNLINDAPGDNTKNPDKVLRKNSTKKQYINTSTAITSNGAAAVTGDGDTLQPDTDDSQETSATGEVPSDNVKPSPNNYYELYAVLIHKGIGVRGGHYYAFIKSLETGNWFKFDDKIVTTWSKEQLSEAYGGDGTTNAYMLIYKRVDGNAAEQQLVESSQLPGHIEDQLSKMCAQETSDFAGEKSENLCELSPHDIEMFKLRIWYRSPEYEEHYSTEHCSWSYIHLYATSDTTLGEIKQRAIERLKLKQSELYRIIKMNSETARIEYSVDDESQLLANVVDTVERKPSLVLESRLPGVEFIEYPIDSIHPNVIHLELKSPSLNSVIRDIKEVIISYNATVATFKQAISKTFQLEGTNLVLVVDNVCNKPLVIEDNEQSLKQLDFGPHTRCYFTETADDDCVNSAICNLVNALQDTIQIYAVLPPISYVRLVDKKLEDTVEKPSEHATKESNEEVTSEKFFSCLDSNDPDTFRRVLLTINIKESWGWLHGKLAALLDCDYESIGLSTMDLIGSSEEMDIKHEFKDICDHLKMYDQTRSYYPTVELRVTPRSNNIHETRGKVQLLDITNDAQPLSKPIHIRVSKTTTIGVLKKITIEQMAKTYQKDLAYDMCRMRKLTLNTYVSDVLRDKDYLLDHINPTSLWLLCIQEVPTGGKLFSNSIQGSFIFVRRYFPATDTVGPTVELFIQRSTCEEFVAEVVLLSGISADQLIAYICGRNYPAELSGYAKHSIQDWATLSNTEHMCKLWDNHIYGDGHLVYYMYKSELTLQPSSKDNGNYATSLEEIQRKMLCLERPLRILQDCATEPGTIEPSMETAST